MNLQELHLASLGRSNQPMAPAMALALQASFGSVQRWREKFVAMAGAPGKGHGWLVLVFSPAHGKLANVWSSQAASGDGAGLPIVSLDMNEHPLQPSFDHAAAAYAESFVDAIDWAAAYQRYQAAIRQASEAWGIERTEVGDALLLDVRRSGVFEQASTQLPGSRWLDPADVARWLGGLPRERKIVVSCVFGHEVSQAAALRLRAAGIDASFLRGGIDGWQAAGWPLVAKEARLA